MQMWIVLHRNLGVLKHKHAEQKYKLYIDRKLKWQLLEFHALSDHQTRGTGGGGLQSAI